MNALTENELQQFHNGRHRRLFEQFGAHPAVVEGTPGVRFRVWAPRAERVAVMGEFNGWSKDRNPLEREADSELWQAFVPEAAAGMQYKYCIVPRGQSVGVDKADPFAFCSERHPGDASVVWQLDYAWEDDTWMSQRRAAVPLDGPVAFYEVHLGSWMRDLQGGYRELAPRLAEHVHRLGFSHVEFLPVAEHYCERSWGYRTTGFFAPTSRYGSPQDFMYLVDYLHRHEIGVILDWVPAYFAADPHGLSRFDGGPLYECERRDDAPLDGPVRWFDFGRPEVVSFLCSNALFWLEKYHLDGLRVVSVAGMLFPEQRSDQPLSEAGEHLAGSNLNAVALLQQLNEAVHETHPGVVTIADESTAWPMVCWPVQASGGLGFGFQWDTRWMHDVLVYMGRASSERGAYHEKLTQHTDEAFNENVILPLSHDLVTAEQGSLLQHMPGDDWQQRANLRLLLGYLYVQPGKKLLFMGDEFGQQRPWDHDRPLDWDLLKQPEHGGILQWVKDLNRVYRNEPALYEFDRDAEGFEWIDPHDEMHCAISFVRKGWRSERYVLAVCNFAGQMHTNYRVGVPRGGAWREVLNSDATYYGGSGCGNLGGVEATPVPCHGRPHSINITLPPLAIVVFKHDR